MKKYWFCIALCLLAGSIMAQTAPQAVTLTTQDGWKVAGWYVPSKTEPKTVILLHDIGKDHRAFETFTGKLVARGIGYLALDLRGHGASVNKGGYRAFAKEGVDNEYNKMTRDVNAAVEFLQGKGVSEEDMMLVGVGMGANVAAKAASLWPSLGGLALLTPVTNFRDVLPIPSLRVYKGPVFIAAAADDKKTFLEASVMRNVAFLNSGEGNVTFATAYDKKGHELLDAWVSAELLQWILIPQKPLLSPDVIEQPEEQPASYEPIQASDTEEALFPSILQ